MKMMNTVTRRAVRTPRILMLVGTSAILLMSNVALSHDGEHGDWKNSAAAKVCKGQASDADKKACFKQLKTQKKAAMETFENGFTYTPAGGTASGQ